MYNILQVDDEVSKEISLVRNKEPTVLPNGNWLKMSPHYNDLPINATFD